MSEEGCWTCTLKEKDPREDRRGCGITCITENLKEKGPAKQDTVTVKSGGSVYKTASPEKKKSKKRKVIL